MNRQEIIEKCLTKLGVTAEGAAEKLDKYAEFMVEQNKMFNLTAITEFEDIVAKHFADSLAPIATGIVSRETKGMKEGNVSRETPVTIIDVGTGAGLPGIPLAIALPEVKVTLLDALAKRITFLKETAEILPLTNIYPVHARAEDAARSELREAFDISVSRAVADLSILAEYCLPFVRKGGIFISYKADNCEEEVESAAAAIATLGGRLQKIVKFDVPGTDITRSLVIIEKISDTPDKYPRRAGLPEKKPIR